MNESFWIIDQLVQQGVTHFCIAPGSRSTPLVVAATEHPKATTLVHFDERGLGFYALGFGKGAKRPAAVIVTSGTAVGNLLPSVMEAFHSSTPLLILTADRPPELHDCGANQTCEQVKPFTSFVRWQANLPPSLNERYFRSIATQAIDYATKNHPGPVQLNCQFRERLYASTHPQPQGAPVPHFPTRLIPSPIQTDAARGIILLGAIPASPLPILDLARRLKWPVFADILSNARNHPSLEQIRHFDTLLNQNSPSPDFVLHLGERMTAKEALDYPIDLHVSSYPFFQDPMRCLATRIQCDIESFCAQFTAKTDPSWLPLWQSLDHTAHDTLTRALQNNTPFTEALFLHQLSQKIPPDNAVFLSNGMQIRNADKFLFPKSCNGFFGNRGLSGIDGNIATAVGIANGLNSPLVAILGDQTCLHDLNSLALLGKTKHPVTLIISNNFGGGIFSHLPIAAWPFFETHVAAAHPWSFENAAKMFGVPYRRFPDLAFDASSVIELVTARETNHRFLQELIHRPLA
ncbi:MAG: 2-succinyl-5-enolpyruvyl-6-hydroxy-3-cyclohexene-1-carboxylic-acid synthase [Chlamydiia bacterium]|nr:2-succinyl-5-enolpyruvyl-6-hydroxy-3-cyclohexene-1-carboxylic-acid synthase [Chlamydiia bacterium]